MSHPGYPIVGVEDSTSRTGANADANAHMNLRSNRRLSTVGATSELPVPSLDRHDSDRTAGQSRSGRKRRLQSRSPRKERHSKDEKSQSPNSSQSLNRAPSLNRTRTRTNSQRRSCMPNGSQSGSNPIPTGDAVSQSLNRAQSQNRTKKKSLNSSDRQRSSDRLRTAPDDEHNSKIGEYSHLSFILTINSRYDTGCGVANSRRRVGANAEANADMRLRQERMLLPVGASNELPVRSLDRHDSDPTADQCQSERKRRSQSLNGSRSPNMAQSPNNSQSHSSMPIGSQSPSNPIPTEDSEIADAEETRQQINDYVRSVTRPVHSRYVTIFPDFINLQDDVEMLVEQHVENLTPLRSAGIQLLPTRIHFGTENEPEMKMCLICREDYAYGDEIKNLPCFHEFHALCLHPWLLRSDTCPVCRAVVDFSDQLYD